MIYEGDNYNDVRIMVTIMEMVIMIVMMMMMMMKMTTLMVKKQ